MLKGRSQEVDDLQGSGDGMEFAKGRVGCANDFASYFFNNGETHMESNTDTATLKELVEVLDDGKKFYEDASTKVDSADLRQLFNRMAQTKGVIASDLKTRIVASGKTAPDHGTVTGSLRKAYGEICAKLSKSPSKEYVDQLEGFEDRIVAAFRNAAGKSDDAEVRAVAQKYMPEVLRDHNEMSSLKHTMN
jgi:uncharacterized protein (TIGR02284 family)